MDININVMKDFYFNILIIGFIFFIGCKRDDTATIKNSGIRSLVSESGSAESIEDLEDFFTDNYDGELIVQEHHAFGQAASSYVNEQIDAVFNDIPFDDHIKIGGISVDMNDDPFYSWVDSSGSDLGLYGDIIDIIIYDDNDSIILSDTMYLPKRLFVEIGENFGDTVFNDSIHDGDTLFWTPDYNNPQDILITFSFNPLFQMDSTDYSGYSSVTNSALVYDDGEYIIGSDENNLFEDIPVKSTVRITATRGNYKVATNTQGKLVSVLGFSNAAYVLPYSDN